MKLVVARGWIFSKKNNTRVDVAVFVLATVNLKRFVLWCFLHIQSYNHPPSFHFLTTNVSTTLLSLDATSNALSICCSLLARTPPRVLDLVLPCWILSCNGEHKPSRGGEHQPSQTRSNQLELQAFASSIEQWQKHHLMNYFDTSSPFTQKISKQSRQLLNPANILTKCEILSYDLYFFLIKISIHMNLDCMSLALHPTHCQVSPSLGPKNRRTCLWSSSHVQQVDHGTDSLSHTL